MDKPAFSCYTDFDFCRKVVCPMKNSRVFSALALGGGAAAFLLRLLQNRTGFEPDTGLSIPGNPWGILLPVLLAALAAGTLLLTRSLPREDPPPAFDDAFRTPNAGPIRLLSLGAGCLLLSALLELLRCPLYTETLQGMADGNSGFRALVIGNPLLAPRASLLLGVLGLAGALSLLPAIQACLRRPRLQAVAFDIRLLLVMPVCLLVRLVFVYRVESVSPTLAAYYVELLALAALTLAFYRLSGFGFRAGRTDRQMLWSVLSVALCLAALADCPGLSAGFLYAGGALAQLAFLRMRTETLL